MTPDERLDEIERRIGPGPFAPGSAWADDLWLIRELRDARAEIERWRASQAAHADVYERLTAELAAERAKVQAGLAWLTKAEPFPEINGDMFRGLRAALTGGEQ